MKPIESILQVPFIWDLSQLIFGCDRQKRRLYRSVFLRPGRLLDFGCADGNTFTAFSDFDYYGIDINTRLIDNAARKFSSYENAHFINADILNKPFPDEHFDYVLFACTGHHLEEEMLFKIMTELTAVLKTGGTLHFFDTIRRHGKESKLLQFLIKLDQGKHMRDEERYNVIINLFSNRLSSRSKKVLRVSGTLMPQPAYYYAEFEKI